MDYDSICLDKFYSSLENCIEESVPNIKAFLEQIAASYEDIILNGWVLDTTTMVPYDSFIVLLDGVE